MANSKHTIEELRQRQSLPLEAKIELTYARVRDWVDAYGIQGVYISFSGGKDSTVLMDLIRNRYGYPDMKAMFVDVPTQYPELKQFANTFDNVDIVKPKISFMQVCEKYGFPLISKEVSEVVHGARQYVRELRERGELPTGLIGNGGGEKGIEVTTNTNGFKALANMLNERMANKQGGQNLRLARLLGWSTGNRETPIQVKEITPDFYRSQFSCDRYKFFLDAPFELSDVCCRIMKKAPAHNYCKATGKVPITAQMASESLLRRQQWLNHGCNAFDKKLPVSNPMSFWTEQDVLEYIYINKLPICSVYGKVVPTDIQLTFDDAGFDTGNAPRKQYKTTGCHRTGCMLCGFGCHLEKSPNRFEQLKVTHPGVYGLLDKCKNNGVTFREAIEWTNEHGNMHIEL